MLPYPVEERCRFSKERDRETQKTRDFTVFYQDNPPQVGTLRVFPPASAGGGMSILPEEFHFPHVDHSPPGLARELQSTIPFGQS